MNTRADYQTTWSRNEPGQRTSSTSYSDSENQSMIGSAIDSMIKAPFRMTAAGLNWMTSGMSGGSSSSGRSNESTSSLSSGSTGSSDSGSSWAGWANPANWTSGSSRPANDQDLSGDDVKYVSWTVIFTKPDHEAVLEPMQYDLVNYATDRSSYAAMKLAKFVERARFGKVDKPHAWVEREYPGDSLSAARRAEFKAESSKSEGSKLEVKSESSKDSKDSKDSKESKDKRDSGWRIPSEDQKYLQFLYRVEWRLPKREETTRVERVTVERTSNAHAKIVV